MKRAATEMSPDIPDGSPPDANKRQRLTVQLGVRLDDQGRISDDTNVEDLQGPIMDVERLGFWKCQLCNTPKYLLAGPGRSPAMPCKWPLRDISKMVTRFTAMHQEQDVADRLKELGAALELNRKSSRSLITICHVLTLLPRS